MAKKSEDILFDGEAEDIEQTTTPVMGVQTLTEGVTIMPDTTNSVKQIGGSKAEQKVERKFLEVWTEVTEGEYELTGRGTEDSSIELNPDTSKSTDIYGYTDEDLNKFEPTQNYDPNVLRTGTKLNADLIDKYRRRAYSEFKYNIVVVYLFLKDGKIDFTGTHEADKEADCSIIPQSLGGSSYVGMPISISHSNNVTPGKATYTGEGKDRKMTFTPNTSA